MGIYLADQTIDFLSSCLLGMALALLYDVFRLCRIAVPTRSAVVFAQDVLFWSGCALVTFMFLLTSIDGRVRIFLIAGEVIGAVLYHFTIGVVVMGVSKTIIRVVKAILRGILRYILYPVWRIFYLLVSLLLKPVFFFARKAKKISQRCKYRLKVGRVMLYNHLKGTFRSGLRKKSQGRENPHGTEKEER